MVSEALPDEPPASTTTLVSPSVDGATNGIRAVPDPSVTAVPMEATPTDSVTRRPARGPVVPTTYTVARTPWPTRALVLSSVTVTVNPAIVVTCCAVTESFCVVSFPARSRATTVIGTEPAFAENESLKPPSGVRATMRPFTVMVEPGSVVPVTTMFFASTVLPAVGCETVIVGGVRSSTTLYDDAATTSRSAMSATPIAFGPSFNVSVALNEPLDSRRVVATTAPLRTNCTLRPACTAKDGTLPVSCNCGSRVYAGSESAIGAAPTLVLPPAGSSIEPLPWSSGIADWTCAM